MNYVSIVFIIGGLILIHELGHFLAGRWMGIPMARFSIGFGPKLWAWQRGKTEYRLSWIPVGGYVLPDVQDEKEFFQIPIRKRVVFTLGGPLANILTACLIFAVLNTISTGLSLSGLFVKPFTQTATQLYQMFAMIPQLFSHPDRLSGVVGIVSQGNAFIGGSFLKALSFSILLSVNLAVFNLLPIPALDGGKLLLYALEAIHPKLTRLHIPLAVAGWALLLGLMVYATILDIGRHIL